MSKVVSVVIMAAGGASVEVPPGQELQAFEYNQRAGIIPMHRLAMGEDGELVREVGRYSLEWGRA